jgi:NAD-reducing hydrogenase small subunit
MAEKFKIATCSLAGCFGCHTSFLDIDERILDFIDIAEFNRTPFIDIKRCTGDIDIGLIEGGLSNVENVHTAREFRGHCKILISIGACAINGNIPALRNDLSLRECLEESYVTGIGIENPQIPSDPELPLLLDKVHPVHEVVKIDYFLPGCPPSADAIWKFLSDLMAGRPPSLPYPLMRYD